MPNAIETEQILITLQRFLNANTKNNAAETLLFQFGCELLQCSEDHLMELLSRPEIQFCAKHYDE